MDKIREAFQKIKTDIDFLYNEIGFLRVELEKTREEMLKIVKILQNQIPTQNIQNSTVSTHPSTHNLPLEALKAQNMGISTGNQGVPTDKQTDKQTDTQHKKTNEKTQNLTQNTQKNTQNSLNSMNYIENAAKMLDSLDSIKKEIRLKFKRLTEQEILVFSTLYQLDENPGVEFVDYKTIAVKIGLTESSIRDYIGRLIRKGIPVEKTRVNNKQIHLSISKNLKKIASLPTILQLRDL